MIRKLDQVVQFRTPIRHVLVHVVCLFLLAVAVVDAVVLCLYAYPLAVLLCLCPGSTDVAAAAAAETLYHICDLSFCLSHGLALLLRLQKAGLVTLQLSKITTMRL
uniref:Uncharacterized protein n=1 Tax=Bracon brevicornis TaxID=1563983 RepID=A0A6V7L9I9_9HYME